MITPVSAESPLDIPCTSQDASDGGPLEQSLALIAYKSESCAVFHSKISSAWTP
jgi:hypothetical protein